MLSEEEKAGLAAMDRDQLQKLLALIRKAKAMFLSGGNAMPRSAVEDLVKAVGDEQVRAIVKDLGKGPAQPGGLLGPSGSARERGIGWLKGAQLEPPPGVKWCDQMMDVADAVDRRELKRKLGG